MGWRNISARGCRHATPTGPENGSAPASTWGAGAAVCRWVGSVSTRTRGGWSPPWRRLGHGAVGIPGISTMDEASGAAMSTGWPQSSIFMTVSAPAMSKVTWRMKFWSSSHTS